MTNRALSSSRRPIAILTAIAGVMVAAISITAPSATSLPAHAAQAAHDHAHTHGPDSIDLAPPVVAAAAPYDVDTPAPWTSVGWMDTATPGTDTADLTILPQVHAVYLYPSDQESRYSNFAAMFEADARDASKKLDAYGRAIRWDERFASENSAQKIVDVTVLKSAHSAATLSDSANQFNLVDAEIRNRLPNDSKKYAVWLDADSNYCGQGTLWSDARRSSSNANERRTTGIVYRPRATDDPVTGGFCRGRTLLHELGHNFGALQGSRAPNDFDGAHCDDSAEDVMCYARQAEARLGTAADTGPQVFDHQMNDYWDRGAQLALTPTRKTKLSWWTVNLSKFVCPTSSTGPDCSKANSNPGY